MATLSPSDFSFGQDTLSPENNMSESTVQNSNPPHVSNVKAKGQRLAQTFDAEETKRALLQLMPDESPDTGSPDTSSPVSPVAGSSSPLSSRGIASVWWPSFKRAVSGRSNTELSKGRTVRRPFEIEANDLKVGAKVGEGLRSEVFAGELEPDGQKVAVRRLKTFWAADAEKKANFVSDLETLSRILRHPGIVHLLGVNQPPEGGGVSLVYEYMGGGTLESFFDSRSSDGCVHNLPLSVALSYAKQLFEGLQFLHERDEPIVVRDLKPCNLLLSSDYKTLKMKDFGVAKTTNVGLKILQKAKNNQSHELLGIDLNNLPGASTKGFTGTARYLAPEVDMKAKSADYTPAVDVYSATMILWFVLEGQRPWESHHESIALKEVKKGRRPLLRRDGKRYPLSMAALIGQGWAQNPIARPSARQMLLAMDDICRHQAEEVSEVGCMSPLFRTRSGRIL